MPNIRSQEDRSKDRKHQADEKKADRMAASESFDAATSIGSTINENLGLPLETSGDLSSEEAALQVERDASFLNSTRAIPHQGQDQDLGSPGAALPDEGPMQASILGQQPDHHAAYGSTGQSLVPQNDERSQGGVSDTPASQTEARGQSSQPLSDKMQRLRQNAVAKGEAFAHERWNRVSDDLKSRASGLNENIRHKPYSFILGAVGVGFILGKIFSENRE